MTNPRPLVRTSLSAGPPGRSLGDELRVFKALSHQTRVQMLTLLDGGEHTVNELTSAFDLAQPSISRHLSILRKADLVHRRRAGQCVYYGLEAAALNRALLGFLARFRHTPARRSASPARRVGLRPHAGAAG